MTESAPLPKPIVLESQKLGMGTIRSIAVSPDASRVYLGRQGSYDRRCLNLGVLSLDADVDPVVDNGKKGGQAKTLPRQRKRSRKKVWPCCHHWDLRGTKESLPDGHLRERYHSGISSLPQGLRPGRARRPSREASHLRYDEPTNVNKLK